MLSLLYPSLALAAVTISPGQTILINPGPEGTEVSCRATAGTAPAVGASSPAGAGAGASRSASDFCFCRSRVVDASIEYHLTKVVITASGERVETELKVYDTQKKCDQGVAKYPSCR